MVIKKVVLKGKDHSLFPLQIVSIEEIKHSSRICWNAGKVTDHRTGEEAQIKLSGGPASLGMSWLKYLLIRRKKVKSLVCGLFLVKGDV